MLQVPAAATVATVQDTGQGLPSPVACHLKQEWLLHSGRVMELNRPPDVLNPLSVPIQPNGKKRLILYLRYINNFLIKQRVKYEDWKIAYPISKRVLL